VFSWVQRQAFRQGSLLAAFPGAFWVNSPATAPLADNKLYQHTYALGLGFTLPDSLYTNDPYAIRSFIQSHGGQAIYKAFPAPGWKDGTTELAVHTVHITENDLVSDPLLLATPGIYQEVVPKSHEIRLTIMGSHAFPAMVLSQHTLQGRIDWRRAYDEIEMRTTTVPDSLIQSCQALMKRLNLVFGCFDFVVTPDGDYVFLEVNQQGQFSFVEQYTGIPLLDAFTEFLIQGRPDFTWSASTTRIRHDDVAAAANELAVESAGMHVRPPKPLVSE
jgi:glutathione synthase/RimK-type ligase-like ATP-grasp enzyme